MATLMSQVKAIVTGHNTSGRRVLWAVEQSIDHMFKHKDWTLLAWIMAKMEVSADGALVRKIVGECVGGITLKTKGPLAAAQPSGMYIIMAENAGYTEKMPILRKLVKDGESFRGKAVREKLFDKVTPDFDLHKFAERMLKKLDTEGVTLAALLEEVGKVQKAEGVIDVTKPEAADKKVKVQPKAA